MVGIRSAFEHYDTYQLRNILVFTKKIDKLKRFSIQKFTYILCYSRDSKTVFIWEIKFDHGIGRNESFVSGGKTEHQEMEDLSVD